MWLHLELHQNSILQRESYETQVLHTFFFCEKDEAGQEDDPQMNVSLLCTAFYFQNLA